VLAGAAAVLLLVLSVRSHLTRQRTQQYERVKQELAEAEKKRPLYRQMRQQASTLRTGPGKDGTGSNTMPTLTAVLPASEKFNHLRSPSAVREAFGSAFRRAAEKSSPSWTNNSAPPATTSSRWRLLPGRTGLATIFDRW